MKPTFLAALLVALAAFPLHADDLASARLQNWHQWRGPNADGTAPLGDPPVRWSEEENVRWKVEIPGRGSATPVVWNDRVFILTAMPSERRGRESRVTDSEAPRSRQQPGGGRRGRFGGGGAGGAAGASAPHEFIVLCLDRQTGDVLWRETAIETVPHEGHHGTNTYASASPVTDGEFVYASFGSRGLYCYDMEGELQWKRDLGRMRTRMGFGEGSTPTLHGDALVVTWDHEGDSSVLVLDAKTGETRWQVERDEPTTWSTPLVVDHDGRTQVVVHGTNRVRSYDLASGDVLWECGGQVSNPIACPIVLDGLVYCTTGHRGYALYAIPLDASGDLTDTEKVAWRRTDIGSYIASPVLYEGLLYVSRGRDAILSVFDARSGEPRTAPRRLPALGTLYASPVAAAGRVYVTDRDGTTLVLKHGEELEVLATNRLEDGIDASPAIVGRQMLLRGERHLYCLENQGAE